MIPFSSDLPWEVIGAVPETLQTAHGSLNTGLDLQPGQTLLVRGGSSALGMSVTALAKQLGAKVIATTRQSDRVQALTDHGADHVVLDTGQIAGEVRRLVPGGVDAALELVGTPTLPDTLQFTRVHGTVCFAGMLSNEWTVQDFYPIEYIPRGVRLTAYGGSSDDLDPDLLQRYLNGIGAEAISPGPIRVYPFDEIRRAHDDLEHNRGFGKYVVLTGSPEAA